jgi:hypothetical protein
MTPETKTGRYANHRDLGVTAEEYAILRQLNRPAKVQRYLDAVPINSEIGGETILSVREVLRQRRAHCIEGEAVSNRPERVDSECWPWRKQFERLRQRRPRMTSRLSVPCFPICQSRA